jgi:hypothetical protein
LRIVRLGNGLEEIGKEAFKYCELLYRIIIPNAVRVIEYGAFSNCSELTTVTLGGRLVEIGEYAFKWCQFEDIVIPPAVKRIHDTAFKDSSELSSIKFCEEIEEFVSCEAKRYW